MRYADRQMAPAASVAAVNWSRVGAAMTVAALSAASWMVLIRGAQLIF